MHVSYSSETVFLALPVFVMMVSFFLGMTLDTLTETVSLEELISLANVGVFLYGLSVGAFGFLGRTYVERRHGKDNFIIATPTILPLSFKRTFFGMYLRDVIFYLSLILLPALVGMLISAPLAGLSVVSILSVFSAVFLTFLFGISLSFFVSVVFTRTLVGFVVIVGGYILLLIGHGLLGLYGLEVVLPTIGLQFSLPPLQQGDDALLYLCLTGLLTAAFVVLALALVREYYEGSRTRVPELLPSYLPRFGFAGKYQPLLAKEFVDLVRSGTLWKMIFSFAAPLIFLSFSTWYVNYGLGLPVGFNTVFYAAMVGFFGVLLYSWLTNVDLSDYFETLPVAMPLVIRVKLIVYAILIMGISTGFVILIAWVNGEMDMLWLALPVLYIVSAYVVVATAYLTGLSPSSFLFNPEILVKFTIISTLPALGIAILSFSLNSSPAIAATGIAIVCAFLLLSTLLFYRGIESKWGGQPFA